MANSLNTTVIGDEFERRSVEIITKVIKEGQLGYLSDCLRIYPKGKYHSKLRGDDIIFDLAIEVWPPGASRYVMIYLIECKSYKTRVPVDRIEAFHSKIQQVSGVNAKGIFITNSPLQKSALAMAETIGMMVIQGESSDNYNIILHRTNRQFGNRIPFIDNHIDTASFDTGITLLEKELEKAIQSAFTSIFNISRVSYGIDKLSKSDIEQIALEELNKINPLVLSNAHPLSQNVLKEYLRDRLKLKLVSLDSRSNKLGNCNIEHNTIGLNESISATNREFFTLAHEFGHYILHQKLSIGQSAYDLFEDIEFNFRTKRYELSAPNQWIEWQANYFAASLILPKEPFLYRIWQFQDELKMSRTIILLNDHPQTGTNFMNLISRLAYSFDVSKTTIIYRLKEMNLINNQSRLKSIAQIIEDYKEELFT